jgi:hypothetical protein
MSRNEDTEEASAEKMPHLAASVLSDSKEQPIEITFPPINAELSGTDLKYLEDFSQPHKLTFKYVVVLISLTFLFISSAAPFYLILSSLSMPVSLAFSY